MPALEILRHDLENHAENCREHQKQLDKKIESLREDLKDVKGCSLPKSRCDEIKTQCYARMDRCATKEEIKVITTNYGHLIWGLRIASGAIILYLLRGVLEGRVQL